MSATKSSKNRVFTQKRNLRRKFFRELVFDEFFDSGGRESFRGHAVDLLRHQPRDQRLHSEVFERAGDPRRVNPAKGETGC